MTRSNAPTATHYLPSEGIERDLQATFRGGMEIVRERDHTDAINDVFVCDECGQSESVESDMAWHLEQHYDQMDKLSDMQDPSDIPAK
jgi:hypothetical protein